MRRLKLKVWVVCVLRWCRLIPDVWYECEIRLSVIEADKLDKYFNG